MIIETRQLHIEEKVIFLTDLHKLAFIAYNEYQIGKKKTKANTSSFSVSVQCFDGSSFESGDLALLEENSPVSRKRLSQMEINATGPDGDEQQWRIRIQIGHGDYARAGVLIEGRNSIWVNGVMSKFSDSISAFTPQNTLLKRHRRLLFIIGGCGIGCMIYLITDAIFFIFVAQSFSKSGGEKLFLHFMTTLCGLVLSDQYLIRIQELWPRIELATGPEHAQIEKKRRAWLGTFTILVIIPLIVNIVYDVFKAFFK